MRAISIRQPWADHILDGIKTTEFRSINTRIRGRVYIYASMKPDGKEYVKWWALPTGKIVGSVEIVGSKKIDGAYHWFLRNPRRLKRPIKPKKHPQPVFFNPF